MQMKKFILIILIFSMVWGVAVPVAASEHEITVTVVDSHGQRPVVFPDQSPVIIDGRLLVPVRALFETLGFEVAWDDGNVTITGEEYVLNFSISKDVFTIDGRRYRRLDAPVQIIGNRTMATAEPLLNYLGFRYQFEDYEVLIVTPSGRSHLNIEDMIAYTVQAGDTLARIAAQFQSSVELIMEANNLTPATPLMLGMVLLIPQPPE